MFLKLHAFITSADVAYTAIVYGVSYLSFFHWSTIGVLAAHAAYRLYCKVNPFGKKSA